ncbi:NAD(P)-binding domain-containing protein [Alicyclobacillus fastidiosus]|uniref:NAD(P)-binding domain-containing protein n=1 Tax=Alicyclobacillus fastidiosus TaxID=392011 RepID=A0ABY6ZG42_9BACL|nr:pyrroline-5-carboxylate reductase dimerization domain-containing protein [Alicyclobacillus fastidiosus]WAH41467.1 NAD(P)-binding domain-containing protein [Alicyclobacillus fastidiosus]
MQIGIVGTGQMGGMLARAFAETAPENVYVFNRSRAKAESVAADLTNVIVCDDWETLIERVDAVFLCTKGKDGLSLIKKLGPLLKSDQLLVTTISNIDLDRWQELTPATPVKLIPSLTQTIHRGVMLLSYPRDVPGPQKTELENRLCQIGKPLIVDEGQVRVCSDLASCGPAFLVAICQSWAQAAAQTGSLERSTAEMILKEMLIGLAALLDSGMQFDDVVEKIRVPNGVTDRGIVSMEDVPLRLFTRLHAETARYAQVGQRTSIPAPLPSSGG